MFMKQSNVILSTFTLSLYIEDNTCNNAHSTFGIFVLGLGV